jgi:hypothetical protein
LNPRANEAKGRVQRLKRVGLAVLVAVAALACLCSSAFAYGVSYPGMEKLHFNAGPYAVHPGANLILLDSDKVPKPNVDGYMVRFVPNLRLAKPNGSCCGKIPMVSRIHLHHGVWLSTGGAGQGEGNGYVGGGIYPFMATGEEKTITTFPHGYGYPIAAKDQWILNYMIHNLTSHPAKVYINYEIDFVPASDPASQGITPVHPIWMDVEDHHVYPVFNVKQGSGKNGKFTFPNMAKDPYGKGPVQPLNEFTVDHPGTLIGTAGHLHPGGLYDTLDLTRQGAQPSNGAIPGGGPNSVRLFRSYAHYFDKRGPISWNLAMTATPANWRPQVKAGDVLSVNTTYNTTRASWYEVMGIMVVWEAWNTTNGTDPFDHKLNEHGQITHGYLKQNNDNGGSYSTGINVMTRPQCFTHTVNISQFQFDPGDFNATGHNRCIPTIREGQQLKFVNNDASPLSPGSPLSPTAAYMASVFHTVTACKNPCNLNTGISYPLANGKGGYDSGQLGLGTPAVNQLSWSTPTTLKPGTYTFYCRIHPWMRGVFRIIG